MFNKIIDAIYRYNNRLKARNNPNPRPMPKFETGGTVKQSGMWIETKDTGERYYRYDFDNGDSIVVKVYYCKIFNYKATNLDYEDRFSDGWGKEEYYLLETGKYFKDCETNKSSLIEYLKDLQKKGV